MVYNKTWYQNHKKEQVAKQIKWNKEHPESFKKAQKRYRAKPKVKQHYLSMNKEWKKENREHWNKMQEKINKKSRRRKKAFPKAIRKHEAKKLKEGLSIVFGGNAS